MDKPNPDRATVWQIAVAGAVGALLTAIPIALSIVFSGGGHGTEVPFVAHFAPIWLAWMLMSSSEIPTIREYTAIFTGMVALYAIYGGILALARPQRFGRLAWFVCLAVHYLSVICLVLSAGLAAILSEFLVIVTRLPLSEVILLFEYFVGLHILGFQYAGTRGPFRPRLTWGAAVALLAGLLASLACRGWGRALL